MPREKEGFRDNLVRLDEKFPDREIISLKDCARFLGIDTRTVKKRYKITKAGVSKVQLARLLS